MPDARMDAERAAFRRAERRLMQLRHRHMLLPFRSVSVLLRTPPLPLTKAFSLDETVTLTVSVWWKAALHRLQR